MIINSIRAENVLKYATLSIDLAERGLVAISGQNESGKSSIGETVCFALFGRTFSIPPDEIERIVRWGESHCDVTLEFSVEDRRYVLSRFLDRDGNHSARLALAETPDEPLARGIQPVADAVFGLLGFEYAEFVESFYLAQREITTPHPHSQAVKIMAGVAPLEQVTVSLENEIAEREELLVELRTEWEAVDRDVKALGIQEGRMPRLEDRRHEIDQRATQIEGLIGEIDNGLAVCQRNTEAVDRAESARGRTKALRLLALLLAVCSGGLWLLLTLGGDLAEAGAASDILARNLPQWDETKVPWIGYAAAAFGGLFLLLWLRVAGLNSRMRRLRTETAQLGEVLERARAVTADGTGLAAAGDAAAPGQADPAVAETAAVDAAARPRRAEYETLRGRLDRGEATARMAHEYCTRETEWLGAVAQQLRDQLVGLDAEIDDEQQRLQEAIDLSEVLNGLTDKREEVGERIQDRRRGLELLAGAIVHLSNNFNRDIREIVGKILPLFTDGRYEHLQIDEGLKVRVFSNDKRDFMDLEEVSSGTQRQVMLALRLALAQQLLRRRVKGRQFAFLDEPFAFFDQERTRRAVQALTELGEGISQVWIVAQDFPENCRVAFDTTIFCERASRTLTVPS